MFKKLTERFPAAAKGSAFMESWSSSTSGQAGGASAPSTTESAERAEDEEVNVKDTAEVPSRTSSTGSDKSMKAAFSEKINSESVSAAATIAASSMMGFMKKAQSVASVAAREGAAKAVVWKNKAMDAADMDALQRRLSHALDRSTGDVNVELLNFSYITDNIIAMGFPSMNTGVHRTFIKDNPIDIVSAYMNDKHGGHYMIWNLSEENYDYSYFDNQVLEFNFPGHPAPPLGLMFKICSSIESWIEADEKNIAAIHCLTGKGRTGTVISCYLSWVGFFPSAMEALEYVAEQRRSSVEKLTIPSQRRYIQYFSNVMEGVKPRSSPLLLRRVIINSIPVFGKRKTLKPSDSGIEGEMQEVVTEGCCPYLQIFKAGKLVFTTTWKDMEDGNGVQWASQSDESVSFNVNCMLQGDILVRCRHLTDSGERVSMFRAAFHTGYIPQGILRLTKPQLDGACGDDRFDQDFFVDLIFADVQTEGDTATENVPRSEGIALNEEDRQAYEDMLHRDEAFWEDIEARKERLKGVREEQARKRQAAAAEAAAKAEAEAAALAKAKEMEAKKKAAAAFSITGNDEEKKPRTSKLNRRSSWDEEKDKELMSELESLTSVSSATKTADDELLLHHELEEKDASKVSAEDASPDSMDGLAREFEDMKKLEKELGLEPFSSELEGLPDGKLDATSLDLLDEELKGLGGISPRNGGLSPTNGDDALNFATDDFDELEQYLSGLASNSTSKP